MQNNPQYGPKYDPMVIDANEPIRPLPPVPVDLNSRFMWAHPAHVIALGFGAGLSRIMPGTVGSLLGWLSFNVLSNYVSAATWPWLIGLGFLIGVWACEVTGKHLGVADHGGMVWDEIIAMWLVLWFLAPASLATQCWAFVWFRIFDMSKPPPIRNFERRFKNGFGVMADDILAVFFTLLVFALWRAL